MVKLRSQDYKGILRLNRDWAQPGWSAHLHRALASLTLEGITGVVPPAQFRQLAFRGPRKQLHRTRQCRTRELTF